MNCCSGHKMRLYILLIGAVAFWGAIFSGCSSSGNGGITLNGYTFHSDSASSTNRYLPHSAGHVISFVGHGSFEGSSYTWMFTEGEIIQGVATVHEKGFLTNSKGETSILFDSMLAQDVHGKVHVLKTGGALSGVAAGLSATILMPGNPKVGDSFAPGTNYTGTVLSLNETVDSYTVYRGPIGQQERPVRRLLGTGDRAGQVGMVVGRWHDRVLGKVVPGHPYHAGRSAGMHAAGDSRRGCKACLFREVQSTHKRIGTTRGIWLGCSLLGYDCMPL